ncbi:MAG: D-2-hydroxyacid dehydrogenase [bacterium]
MNITFLDQGTVQYRNGELDYSVLKTLGHLTTFNTTSSEEISAHAEDAEVLVLNKVPMTRAVLEHLPKLKLIAMTATGYDNVDVAAARELGIAVANVPGYSTNSVAQLSITFMLALATRFVDHVQDTRKGQWKSDARFQYFSFELAGKTLGIVGFGTIGQQVARVAQAFGMQVLVSTPNEKSFPNVSYVDLNTLAQQSDFVSIHCLLNEKTTKLISRDILLAMKPTAFLINTARGGIVDEAALIDVLREKKIAGAGLDVLTKEPPDKKNPLLTMENVLMTPHVAWGPLETRQRLVGEIAENIRCFVAGKPRNLVN